MSVRDIALQAKGVRAKIGGFQILNGTSLTVTRGQCMGVIGPNGSGKTTFFNALSGFIPLRGGSITFHGRDISKLRAHQRAKLGMGRVFQNSGVFREMTVIDNLLTALECRDGLLRTLLPWSKRLKELRTEAMESLEQVGLVKHAGSRASSLSGGQLRLLEIARTLAGGAELLLLDEPTAGVSPRMKGELTALLQKLKSLNKTILIIEHDMNFIEQLADRVAVLDLGRVVLEGTSREVKSSPMLQEIYFGAGTREDEEEAAKESAPQ